jgi:ubiquinone/menaquinone biosynthesis C-methylase UbiE
MNEISPYLRLIGKIANTRHPGGLAASEFLLNKTNIDKSWRVLDLGCGAGHTSAHIAKKYGCFVNGIDISSAALENAVALYKNEPYFDRLQFEQADLSQLPFSDAYFNAVLCESVLLFNEQKESALAEMTRIIKPGGFLVLNELCIADGANEKIREYFARPEFGGYLCEAQRLNSGLSALGFTIKVHDESTFNLLEQVKADFAQFGNMKGVYQLLELAHQTLTNKEVRQDLWQVAKFLLDMPAGLKKLVSLKLLAQKA